MDRMLLSDPYQILWTGIWESSVLYRPYPEKILARSFILAGLERIRLLMSKVCICITAYESLAGQLFFKICNKMGRCRTSKGDTTPL